MKKGIFFIGLCVLLCGCGLKQEGVYTKPVEVTVNSETKLTGSNIYDSEDTAIFLYCDVEKKEAHFQNISTGKRYTLSYSAGTTVLDRYGEHISMPQIKNGTVSKVRFYKPTKNLTYIIEETDCVCFRELDRYELDLEDVSITIQGQRYRFNKNLTVMSQNDEITLLDIDSVDKISVWGYNEQIYSIGVDKGHGFLTFSNDSYFIDGWVEVGEKVIKKINEDMRLIVPEGSYVVSVISGSTTASKRISFTRNETINWDLGEIEIVTPKTGKIIFTITPTSARVYIDGEEVDITYPVELDYGIHQITVIATGYDTLSKYMKVGSGLANISIDLEKQENKDEQSEEASKADEAKNKEDDKTNVQEVEDTTSYKVYIDKPEGAEVYVDGNYIGIAPVSFPKNKGTRVITLRQNGYQTRSYSLEIDGEEKDTTYSFSELEKNQ